MQSKGRMRRIALITGAGTGIGASAAKHLFNADYTVILTGRTLSKLQGTISAISPQQGAAARLIAIPCDVSSPSHVKSLFQTIEATYGRLDVLFNNAGVGAPAVPMEDLTFDQLMSVVNTNLVGSFLCAQEAVRMMKRQHPQGGRIINNGSISAHTPRPFSAPYTSTKHAITGLTKSISLDGRAFGICCGQIDIGNAATDMTERMARGVVRRPCYCCCCLAGLLTSGMGEGSCSQTAQRKQKREWMVYRRSDFPCVCMCHRPHGVCVCMGKWMRSAGLSCTWHNCRSRQTSSS